MTLNCAIGVILINLIILGCFIVGFVLPVTLTGYVLFRLVSAIF